jgi:hypothetical protein
MFDLRSMALPVPPWPWKAKTSGAGRDESPGTTMTAVRVVPPTSNEASCRPGVYLPSEADVAVTAVDGGAVDDVDDEEGDCVESPPDEHPAASAPTTTTIPIAANQPLGLMTSLSACTCARSMTPL